MENLTPTQMIAEALKSLDDKLHNVLIVHNGFDGTPGLSFEEMSNRLSLPPETLAEAEKRALRKLRHHRACKVIIEAVKRIDQDIWHSLSTDDNVVYKANLAQQIPKCLPGEFLIGIKCLYASVTNWLSHNACQNAIAWFRSEYPDKTVLETTGRLKRLHRRVQLPLPHQRVAQVLEIDDQLLKQVLALSTNRIGTYRGYVAMPPIAARTLRAIRLHLMFKYRYPGDILSVEQLLSEYLQTYSDDNPTARDIDLAMTENPHMFMKLGSIGWCSILAMAGGNPYEKEGDPLIREPDEDKEIYFFKRPRLEASALEIIKEIMNSRGICRPHEIIDEFNEKAGDRFAGVQIAPLIAQSYDFIQLAPTVYSLRESSSKLDPITAFSDFLMTKSDVRWYTISRYAGEPMNTYPLWTPAMERRWCYWAEENATNPAKRRLFHSLLYIAEPGYWPGTNDEKKYWLRIKEWTGHYYLEHECKHQLWHKKPPLRDLLALAICTCRAGSMNRIRVNRSAGYYAFDQNSITHLALLIALGILLPTDHWQKPHKIGHRANVIRAELLETIQENGSISWDSGIGLDLRRQLHRITYNKDLGWVAPQDLAILARKLDGEQTDPNGICNKKKNKQVFQSPKQLELPF